MEDQCEVKRCRQLSAITYAAGKGKKQRGVCLRCFDKHCDKTINLKLKKTFTK